MADIPKDYMFWGLFLVAVAGLTYYNRQQCISDSKRAREYGFSLNI